MAKLINALLFDPGHVSRPVIIEDSDSIIRYLINGCPTKAPMGDDGVLYFNPEHNQDLTQDFNRMVFLNGIPVPIWGPFVVVGVAPDKQRCDIPFPLFMECFSKYRYPDKIRQDENGNLQIATRNNPLGDSFLQRLINELSADDEDEEQEDA